MDKSNNRSSLSSKTKFDDGIPGSQSSPSNQVELLLSLYKAGKYEVILAQSGKLRKQFPKSAIICNIIAAAAFALKNFDISLKFFTEAANINPNDAGVHNNLGNVLRRTGHLDAAIKKFYEAVALKPEFSEAYNNLGNVFKEKGDFEKAIGAFKRSIEINPNVSHAYNSLGHIYFSLDDASSAISHFTKALQIDPNNHEISKNLGDVYALIGNNRAALQSYEIALKLSLPDSDTLYRKGRMHLVLGQLTEATASFREALRLNPKNTKSFEILESLNTQLMNSDILYADIHKDSLKFIDTSITLEPRISTIMAIRAFITMDYSSVNLNLKNLETNRLLSIKKKLPKVYQFCIAYKVLLEKLMTFQQPKTNVVSETIYHLGESHCLSFAHQNINYKGKLCTIIPKITFGAKAYHLGKSGENLLKIITRLNFNSIPNNSVVFMSFGEIDCRIDEGISYASRKNKHQLQQIVESTVRGYVDWVVELNRTKNHDIWLINVPAPMMRKKYPMSDFEELCRIIETFNEYLTTAARSYNINVIDVHGLTKDDHGKSNKVYHVDNYHLGPSILPKLKNQLPI